MLRLQVQRTLLLAFLAKRLMDSSRELMKTGPKEAMRPSPLSSFGGHRGRQSAVSEQTPSPPSSFQAPHSSFGGHRTQHASSQNGISRFAEPISEPLISAERVSSSAEPASEPIVSPKPISSPSIEPVSESSPVPSSSEPLTSSPFNKSRHSPTSSSFHKPLSHTRASRGFVSAKSFIRGSFRYRHTRWRQRRPRRMNHRRIWRAYLRLVRERFFYRQLGRISRRDRESIGRLRGRYTFHHQQRLREELGQRGRQLRRSKAGRNGTHKPGSP